MPCRQMGDPSVVAVTNPPAKPGALRSEPPKAAELWAAHERPREPPEGGGLWQAQLLLPSILLLVFADVLSDGCFVSTYGRHEVAASPEVLSDEVALVIEERSGYGSCSSP